MNDFLIDGLIVYGFIQILIAIFKNGYISKVYFENISEYGLSLFDLLYAIIFLPAILIIIIIVFILGGIFFIEEFFEDIFDKLRSIIIWKGKNK